MLQMSTDLREQMHLHCERAYPEEACGVLAGSSDSRGRTVRQVIPCGNARQDAPRSRYQISPRELIAAQKQARAAGQEIVGFYHSHPDAAPRWSATDLAEAHWLHCSYVIVSVMQGRTGKVASYALEGTLEEDKRFEEERIESE